MSTLNGRWDKYKKTKPWSIETKITYAVIEIIKCYDLIDLLIKINEKEEEKYNYPIIPFKISKHLAEKTIKEVAIKIKKEVKKILEQENSDLKANLETAKSWHSGEVDLNDKLMKENIDLKDTIKIMIDWINKQNFPNKFELSILKKEVSND